MTRAQYFRLAGQMPASWLAACAADPSKHMRPRHVALCRLAIRKKEGRNNG